MDSDTIYLTREGHEKLSNELKHLQTVRRHEISRQISEARGHGDLSENAEYDAAKEAQALNELKIAQLHGKLASARVMPADNLPTDKIIIGSTTELKDLSDGEQFSYTLVSEVEADFSQGKISVSSPIGKTLLGHKKGDEVQIRVPAGMLTYKILSISRQS
jgi:transcription elongation factor GreA